MEFKTEDPNSLDPGVRNRVLCTTSYYLKEDGIVEGMWKVSHVDMGSNLSCTVKQLNKTLTVKQLIFEPQFI